MRVLFRLVIASVLLFSGTAFGRCFPENTAINPMTVAKGGISKAEYDEVLDLIEKAYGPEVQSRGFNLKIARKWTDDTINADTTVSGTDWVINAYGGLARFKQGNAEMSKAGYLAVTCHELGHHLAGAPLYRNGVWPGGGAAVEGSADYWATLICMKRLDPQHADSASQTLAEVLGSLGSEPVPNRNTPDLKVVRQTYEGHPAAQCRLDTYLAGLNCNISSGDMSDADPKVNSCWSYPTATTYGFGSRPRCWFALPLNADGTEE